MLINSLLLFGEIQLFSLLHEFLCLFRLIVNENDLLGKLNLILILFLKNFIIYIYFLRVKKILVGLFIFLLFYFFISVKLYIIIYIFFFVYTLYKLTKSLQLSYTWLIFISNKISITWRIRGFIYSSLFKFFYSFHYFSLF